MGSGKTITALSMVIQFKYPIMIICTKASKKNFQDDIKKMGIESSRIQIITYKKIIAKIIDNQITLDKYSVIIDEAHHLRSGTKLQTILIHECQRAKKIVLLTGTIFYNALTDLSVLVNIIHKDEVLPESNAEFKFFYYSDQYQVPTNVENLKTKLDSTISYYSKPHDIHYPQVQTSYIKVDMTNTQISEYRHYLKKILSLDNIQHIDYTILDKRKVNNFLNVTRQLSNTLDNSPEYPKITEIYNYIVKHPKPVVVYSNFLMNGLFPLAQLLSTNKIKYGIYSGEKTEEKRDSLINNYNQGIIDVLLISSAGSESLDLKNTRYIHIMEPHWNDSKINQIIGRGVRYDSHADLPLEDRTIHIIKWISVFGYKIPFETADEYLISLSKAKDQMFKQFDDIIISASI